jgi:large subunit ribosomal protein L30e
MKELRAALKENKVVIGSKTTVKHLKTGKVKLIVLASNCPDNIRKDLEHYTKLSGIICGKPFAIASLAIVSK